MSDLDDCIQLLKVDNESNTRENQILKKFSKGRLQHIRNIVKRGKEIGHSQAAIVKDVNKYISKVYENEIRDIKHIEHVEKEVIPRIYNLLKLVDKDKAFDSILSDPMKSGGANDVARSFLFSSDKVGESSRVSVHQTAKTIRGLLENMLETDLERLGLSKAAASGILDIESARVTDMREAGFTDVEISKKITNQDALKYATVLKNFYGGVYDINTAFGMGMQKKKAYMGTHTHNPNTIQATEKKTGIAFNSKQGVVKYLDMEEPIHGLEKGLVEGDSDVSTYVTETLQRILSGEDLKYGHGSRSFNFKSNEAYLEYHKVWGDGSTLLDTAIRAKDSFSRSAASYKVLGPKPMETLKIIDDLVVAHLSPEQGKVYMNDSGGGGAKTTRDYLAKEVMGRHKIHEGFNFAAVTRSISLWVSATKVGKGLISTMEDSVNASAHYLSATGNSRLKGLVDLHTDFAKMFASSAERKKWSRYMLMEIDNELGAIQGRLMEGGDGTVDHSSVLARKFDALCGAAVRLTGLPRQTKSARTSIAKAHYFAISDAVETGKIYDPNTRLFAALTSQGITKEDFANLRNYMGEIEGNKLIDMHKLSKEDTNLFLKVNRYLQDAAHRGVQESSVVERAAYSMGFDPNSAPAAAQKLLFSLKSFSLARVRNYRGLMLANPNIQGNSMFSAFKEGQYSDIAMIGGLAASTSMLSGLSTIIKRSLNNEDTEIDGGFIAQALIDGVLPISATYLLDIFAGAHKGDLGNVLERVAGPAYNQMFDTSMAALGFGPAVLGTLQGDEGKAFRKHLKNTAKSIPHIMPGGSLPFVTAAYNRYILSEVTKFLDQKEFYKEQKKEWKDPPAWFGEFNK